MKIGSLWNKWDLHIHSPASYYHEYEFIDKNEEKKYNSDKWEKFIEKLEEIKNIPAIAITDYYSIEGYKKVLNYREKNRLQNFELILPNIEFRLNQFVSRKNKIKKLNYHVIFSNEIDSEVIENEFLKNLKIFHTEGDIRDLTRKNIEKIGENLKLKQKEYHGKSDYFIGCINISVSLDQIQKILKKKRSIFEGKYLLILPDEHWEDISWSGQGHLVRKELYLKSNALFSASEKTRDWALGKKDDFNSFIEEFKSQKPCYYGSDTHSFENFCVPLNKKYCWIKADRTFEGLKQTLYEPEDRIQILEKSPDIIKNIYTIASIKTSGKKINDQLEISEFLLPLNKNLVTIIGGKGSGKTALLDFIANCFLDQCKRSKENKNSFIQRIEEQAGELEVEITFLDKEIGTFKKYISEDSFFKKTKLTYLPQGKIEEFSGDSYKLEEKLKEVIFNNKIVIESNLLDKFNLFNKKLKENEERINSLNSKISSLEIKVGEDIKEEINQNIYVTEGKIKTLNLKLDDFLNSAETKTKDQVIKLKKEEDNQSKKLSELNNVKYSLQRLINNVENYGFINQTISQINKLLKRLEINDLPIIDLEKLQYTLKGVSIKIEEQINKIKKTLNKNYDEFKKIQGIEKEQAFLYKEIERLNSNLKEFEQDLKEFEENIKENESFKKSRKDVFFSLFEDLVELRNLYENIIELFSSGKNEILADIDFKPKIIFKREELYQRTIEILHGRKVKEVEIQEFINKYSKILKEDIDLSSSISEYIEFAKNLKEYVKSSRNSNDFYNLIFTNYFNMITEISYNNTIMEKLSMGQKGTVLLKILLAEGDYPLLIDQPEVDLDNKFIYQDLVKAVRDAKKLRQIIIATHNANLVVNADSEQIIVASYENNNISYNTGSLENLIIREEVATLLEGGREAFIKREKKYGF